MRPAARPLAFAILLGLLPVAAPLAFAAEPVKPPTRATARPATKPATSHQQLKSQAKGLALATETVEQINEAQMNAAMRVLTGDADCEFNQKVIISPVEGQPGHFNVGFKKVVYRMIPQETTTGAVRLEDKKAGVMWLQIPTKSMLMNSKIGQRMVDACTHSEQRAAVAAVAAAAKAMKVAEAASAAAAAMPAASAPAAVDAPTPGAALPASTAPNPLLQPAAPPAAPASGPAG